LGFHQEIFHGSPFGCDKEWLAGIAVVKCDGILRLGHLLWKRCSLPVAKVLCIMAIEVTNTTVKKKE